ncbi:acid phosphatase [Anaeromicropila herbilytica]|uniref:Phospholipid phosphatase n=1 Tax=Anaeromicropila herbilytica TaxID=2785025 RepID=A0A7R7IBI3_9FIRM|nr:phosphatase PAP2 family protein [Anaeromicropila herbilytica]BCN28791.1 phospholipid phosphatase [Anaeromicropila herbilytica]
MRKKQSNPNTKKKKVTSKLMTLLLLTTISSQSMLTAFAASEAKNPDIEPHKASYGYYVDSYKNNSKDNMTPETNPALGVLSGFLKLWTPGSTWNNGTKNNAIILDMNIDKSIAIAKSRTSTDEINAYLDDRRNQNYSVIDGLGPYTNLFKANTNAGTSIPDLIPTDATTKAYEDAGNAHGNWADEDTSLGSIVKLVNTLRGNAATTSPAKSYFQYPRPFRWSSDSILLPTLVPVKKSDPSSDGGFPSGHTNAAYLASIALAYSVPERYQELLTRASELGNNRIVAGMHSCLDVIGGRVMATATAAAVLNDPDNKELKEAAYQAARDVLISQEANSDDNYSDYKTNKNKYTKRLTYGFKQTGDTTKPMVVPKGAEVLLETRLPYLDATARRYVLYTTGLPSGYPVLDDTEGWGRLNLFAAANGYGSFETDVTVTMDASKGGFNATDTWRNDISGSGKLTKKGTGTLKLTGNNSFIGGTVLEKGNLEANSTTALGKGDVIINNGKLIENTSKSLVIGDDFTQAKKGVLVLNIGSSKDILKITDVASFNGLLNINFVNGYVPSKDTAVITYGKLNKNSHFSSVKITGLPKNNNIKVIYKDHSVQLVKTKK